MRIFLVGFMGAGKSVIGRLLSKSLDISFYDLDSEIETKYRTSVSSIFAKYDEACFRKLETNVLQSFADNDDFVMSCGGGTPCFNGNMELINSLGITVYLKLPPDVLATRIYNSVKTRPLTAEKSQEELAEYVEKTLCNRESFYSMAKITIDCTNVDKDEIVRRIASAIARYQ
ncbi:MAG: AAA family ATPase [Bacteroidales bacterium]|nr:AAA family ATPase [Bacteroidales bacterium]